MLFDYNEEEQIKNKKGNIQYFIQIKPFTFNKIFNGNVSIRQFGNSLIFYSKETKQCLGLSDITTISLFTII